VGSAHAHEKQLAKVAKQAKHRTLTLLQPTPREHEDGVTFQVERFATSYAEAGHLLSEHLVQTDQSPDDYLRKNLPLLARLDDLGALQILTARSNGRMFGYLVTVVSPSLDSPDKIEAQHTIFFASPAIRNLGMRLQRASLAFLRERGVTEVIMRAGHRGAGPRLGTFYRRLGAEEFGQLYRLELEEAA
jgi:GNAT superfamily N-acetyltransferase